VVIPLLSNIDMTGVGQLTNLRHLTVDNQDFGPWDVDPLDLSALCGLERLCSLEVDKIDHIAPPPTGHALHHVTNIRVRRSQLRDLDLLYLVRWTPQLEVLTIECCPLLTSEGFTQAVTASPTLRALNIMGPR
jgi:hypothetical protein